MNTKANSRKWPWIQPNQRRAAGTAMLLLLLLTLPAVVQAQFTFTINNGAITITGYTGPGGAVTIPDTTNGYPVTILGHHAFYYCTNLTSVSIPDSVTTIEWCTFQDCSGLTNVAIPNSITKIGSGAFWRCTSLTSVTIPTSVTRIEGGAFQDCSSLTEVAIPDSVMSIGDWAFGGCTRLTAITVDTNNPVYSSMTGVLFDKRQTTLIQYPAGKAGSYKIPASVTSIAVLAFDGCSSLTEVAVPDSVTSIAGAAFYGCSSLSAIKVDALNPVYSSPEGVLFDKNQTTLIQYPAGKAGSYTVPDSVTNIGVGFMYCTNLSSVTIPGSVNILWEGALAFCPGLTGVYFQGNAPRYEPHVFDGDNNATVYYLPGTTGWGATFGGRPTMLWPPATIQWSPLTQTAEAGSAVGLWVEASSPLPLLYLWRLNDTNLMSWSTNCDLELTNVQFSQSGAYAVVVSNVLGATTSESAILNVIAAVERRPVPGVQATGQTGSLMNVDYANSLSPAPSWTTLGSVSLTSTSQYYFDLTLPLPPQRYYRAWRTGTPGAVPPLDLHLVPAITLTGSIGTSLRLDYINQFGPTDAWGTLDRVTLTNTSQLYFDTSAPGQPQRLYRLVPLP